MRRIALVLAFAAVAAATASTVPLHELEALHGHEQCGTSGAAAIGHECHDHDECATCALLNLPHACAHHTSLAIVLAEGSRERGASFREAPPQPDYSSVSARAPPTA